MLQRRTQLRDKGIAGRNGSEQCGTPWPSLRHQGDRYVAQQLPKLSHIAIRGWCMLVVLLADNLPTDHTLVGVTNNGPPGSLEKHQANEIFIMDMETRKAHAFTPVSRIIKILLIGQHLLLFYCTNRAYVRYNVSND